MWTSPKMSIILSAMMMIVLLATACAQGNVQIMKEKTKFFDDYDDPTSLVVTDGRIEVTCFVGGKYKPGLNFELVDPKDNRVASGALDENTSEGKLGFDITESTELGQYKCKYDSVASTNSLDLSYRMCSAQECKTKKCSDETSVCAVLVDGTTSKTECTKKLPCDVHPATELKFCGSGKPWQSACHAIDNDGRTKAFAELLLPGQMDECPIEKHVPHVLYEKNRFYGQRFRVKRASREIRFDFDSLNQKLDGSNLACIVKQRGRSGVIVDQFVHERTRGVSHFKLNDTTVFGQGSQIYKLTCKYEKNGKIEGRIANFLVVIEGEVTLNVTMDKLRAEFTDTLRALTVPDFDAKIEWEVDGAITEQKDPVFDVRKDGRVRAKVTYRLPMCSGSDDNITDVVDSQIVEVKHNPKKEPPTESTGSGQSLESTKPPATTPKEDEGWTAGSIVGVTIGGVAAAIVVVAAVSYGVHYCIVRKPRHEKEKAERMAKEAEKADQSREKKAGETETDGSKKIPLAGKPHHMALPDLKKIGKNAESTELLPEAKSSDDKMNKEETDKTEKDPKNVVIPPGSRYDMPVYKPLCLQVNGQKRAKPMNKFKDYDGNHLYVCQAPLEAYLAEHWALLWQEDIGVIGLVGDFYDGSKEKIKPYFPLTKGEKMTFSTGKGAPKLEFEVMTTMKLTDHRGTDTYIVTVTNKVTNEFREFTFIHVKNWPDFSVPIDLRSLVEAITLLAELQATAVKDGKHPGVLVHCSAGLQRSIALLAVFILRQYYIATGKVDFYGVLEYIRRNRMCALSTKFLRPKQINAQHAVIACLLNAIIDGLRAAKVGRLKAEESDVRAALEFKSQIDAPKPKSILSKSRK